MSQNQAQAQQPARRKLEDLNFDNLSLRALPVDDVFGGPVRQVEGACFSRVAPTPVANPQLVVASPDALSLLDIDPAEISRPDFAEYFSGNKVLPGAEPAAHCYCGHQFGYFSGQLGDGATMYLGEVVNSRGERWELQFKGAGRTPYSRQADGRKVLRSSIREFLCSEAMYHLGVPTTRAGTCVTSDTRVVRDIHYDGNAIMERATVITRIAPTFLRFGSLEIFKPTDPFTGRRGPSAGMEAELLPVLLHHVIRTYYPHLWEAHGGDAIAAGVGVAPGDSGGAPWPPADRGQMEALQAMYLDWLAEVTRRTASLVAAWQCVGWCHGVLNTDNMSLVGVTIDYGPFGFLDRTDPDFVCNGSDDQGRYDYKSQPEMCRWNCEKLAEALRPLVPENRAKRIVGDTFDAEFSRTYIALMRRKLGLGRSMGAPGEAPAAPAAGGQAEDADADEDAVLVSELTALMADTGADFTNTFRCLSRFPVPPPGVDPSSPEAVAGGGVLEYILTQLADPAQLAEAAAPRIPANNLNMLVMLSQKNPDLLHQLGLTQQMLAAEVARMRRSEALRAVTPAAKAAQDREKWAGWLARYGARLQAYGEVATGGAEAWARRRVEVMNATNPRFVLRNWIAQSAIEKAEKGDFSEVNRVHALLRNPFSDADVSELLSGLGQPPTATAAAAAGGAVTDEAASASASVAASVTAAPPSGGGVAAAPAGPSDSAAAATGVSCSLPVYDGKPPAWATKLCVT